jgi:cytochrome c oxidase subunit 2
MDSTLLLTASKILLAVILIIVIVNLTLVFRLKKFDPFANWKANEINGWFFLIFLVGGLIAAFVSSGAHYDLYYLITDPASNHGEEIDSMFWITLWVTTLVFVLTNILLLGFAFLYRSREGRKARYYPENNKLEILWTIVPAIVLTILVARGVGVWHRVMGKAPEEAHHVEVTAEQFAWTVRYPGPDGEFGEASVRHINLATSNSLGFNFDDPKGHDDLLTSEIHLPVGVPVKVHIKSKDVLHNASMPYFRMKMDAVPGLQTSYWFTPTKTTAQMRQIKDNPEFNYELACQELCGGGHWNMRKVIVVETMEEYQQWLSTQQAFYAQWKTLNGIEDAGRTATEVEEAAEEVVEAVDGEGSLSLLD